ncbi:L-2-hydroxyglutarate oxidase [Sediminitomix flava]|uniref:L-2-hydroxyglutarate oxidase n=1 Tax=Sediminitomix flava TaxID=379075 RepID=A0A315ZC62_SEDFL|nr:L-2-hydroxyglutarate oxidase [Sediminitomix flava]PWJ42902.1 L-2-hydroxyglutarate oxidase [Sediminitomix flava]
MTYDVIIIGGGIVGAATALKIKEQRPEAKVLILEKESGLAKHQTGNNSGVIHSGLYYKPGSLKAKNCIRGYNMLLDFCNEHEIPYDLCGKIVVATNTKEVEIMNGLYKRGLENGLTDNKLIRKEEIKKYEPYCEGEAAIHVPYTGIVDYTLVTETYGKVFQEKYNGEIRFNTKVMDVRYGSIATEIITDQGTFRTKLAINCAGLYSDKIAAFNHKNLDFKIVPFRGEYYHLNKKKEHLVKNLIYPVPDPSFPFLGVHFTRMIGGGIEAGPNAVFAFKREGYDKSDFNMKEFIESATYKGFLKVASKYWVTGLGEMYRSYSKSAFTKALQKLMPEIKESDLTAGNAGVRAQALDRNGNMVDDFLILEDSHMINVCNAPSPAATSSLSIGLTIAEMAVKRF